MHVVAVTDHKRSDLDPVQFAPGDALIIGKRDADFPGWIWVTTLSGARGWAPETYIDVQPDGHGVATASYCSAELETKADQVLRVLKELAGWLWVEDEHGRVGWIPKHTTRPA